jgi:hypothetical protein
MGPVLIFTRRYNGYSIYCWVMIMLLKENLIDVWYTGENGEVTDVIELPSHVLNQGELIILAYIKYWVFCKECEGFTEVGYTNPF